MCRCKSQSYDLIHLTFCSRPRRQDNARSLGDNDSTQQENRASRARRRSRLRRCPGARCWRRWRSPRRTAAHSPRDTVSGQQLAVIAAGRSQPRCISSSLLQMDARIVDTDILRCTPRTLASLAWRIRCHPPGQLLRTTSSLSTLSNRSFQCSGLASYCHVNYVINRQA